MISIFLSKRNNKWRVICQYKDEETKRRKQKILGSYERKKDASERLVEEQNKLNKNLFVTPKNLSLSEYMDIWIDSRKNFIERSTYLYYKDMINRKINNTKFGEIKIQEINPIHIEKFYSSLYKSLNTNTVLKYHKMLKKAFSDAHKKQIISSNPIDKIDSPAKSKKSVGKTLNKEEAILYLECSKGTIMELPVHFALVLGLRASEICGIGLDRINFEENKLIIDQVTYKDRETKEVKLKQTKTTSSNRVISIPPSLIDIIKKKYDIEKNNTSNKLGLLITKKDNTPLDSSALSRNFQDFKRKFKDILPNVRFHDLRHTNASLHLLAGTDLKVTSKLLGHSTIGITADLYTHVLTELEEKSVKNIDNLLFN